MESGRRQNADFNQQFTRLNDEEELASAVFREEKRIRKKEDKKRKLQDDSLSYQLVRNTSKYLDEYYLDPIIGLLPGIGDFMTSFFSLPFIYVSLFKVKSIPLTLAVIYNTLVDMVLGCIPALGVILDFINKSFKKNLRLINGFVDDDREIIKKVNKDAVKMVILIAIGVYLIYLLMKLIGIIGEHLTAFYTYILGLI